MAAAGNHEGEPTVASALESWLLQAALCWRMPAIKPLSLVSTVSCLQFGVGAVICFVVTAYRWLYLEESAGTALIASSFHCSRPPTATALSVHTSPFSGLQAGTRLEQEHAPLG